jgi:ribonuclease BN (tRNA processing enzyme)
MLTHIAPWTDREAVLAEARAEFPAAVLVERGETYLV